jgi:hypothetical protein
MIVTDSDQFTGSQLILNAMEVPLAVLAVLIKHIPATELVQPIVQVSHFNAGWKAKALRCWLAMVQ